MPQSTYTPVKITLNISDKVLGATTLKRQAHLFTMIYNQLSKSLVLSWTVEYFSANSDGTYGDSMSSMISSFSKESIADNTTTVDQATGAIIIENLDGSYGDGTQTTMGQYDWFNMMAETQAIPVHNMIRQYGSQVNWDLV